MKQFFQDGDGALSSTRLVLLVWSIGTFTIWSFSAVMAALNHLAMPDIPIGVVGLIGLFITGKVTQSFAENKSAP